MYYQTINDPMQPMIEPDPTTQVPTTEYVGLTQSEAVAKAQADGAAFRVVEIDGEPQPTTLDYREGRINATVTDGMVTAFTIEGSASTTDSQQAEAAAGSQTNPYFVDNGLAGDMVDPQNQPGDTDPGAHDQIIGMTAQAAAAYARTNSIDFRVGTIDGEPQPVTADYKVGRITAELSGDVVVSYTVE